MLHDFFQDIYQALLQLCMRIDLLDSTWILEVNNHQDPV
jgi:hypothetical protein